TCAATNGMFSHSRSFPTRRSSDLVLLHWWPPGRRCPARCASCPPLPEPTAQLSQPHRYRLPSPRRRTFFGSPQERRDGLVDRDGLADGDGDGLVDGDGLTGGVCAAGSAPCGPGCSTAASAMAA